MPIYGGVTYQNATKTTNASGASGTLYSNPNGQQVFVPETLAQPAAPAQPAPIVPIQSFQPAPIQQLQQPVQQQPTPIQPFLPSYGGTDLIQPGGKIIGSAPGGGYRYQTPQGGEQLITDIDKQKLEGTYKEPQTPAKPATEPPGAPGTILGGDYNAQIGQVKNYLAALGISLPNPQNNPLTEFTNTYQQLFKNLGLQDVKERYGDLTKQYGVLNNELQDKIAAVNDNPWISESLRSAKVVKLQQLYERKLDTLTRQLQLQESLFNRGQQEAQFIASHALQITHQGQQLQQDVFNKVIDYVEKQAAAQARTERPFRLSPGQTRYEYNPKTMAYEPTVSLPAKGGKGLAFRGTTGATYASRLGNEINNLYAGRYGTEGARERVISILKQEFPNMNVAKDIYNRVPDNFKIKPEGGKRIISGKLSLTAADIGEGSNRLESSRGEKDKYADTNLYLQMLAHWNVNGGLERDFLKYYPPKNYLNPSNKLIPDRLKQYLRVPTK